MKFSSRLVVATVVVLVGHLVRSAHIDGERLVVFHQLAKHVDRRNELVIVVVDAL